MKKLISLILVMVLLCTCAVSASALSLPPKDEHQLSVEAELLPKLSAYIAERTDNNRVTSVYYLMEGEIEGEKYYLVTFSSDNIIKKEYFYRIGMFAVNGKYEFPVFTDGYAVYTEADDQWHPLGYLYNKDNDTLELLAMYDMFAMSGKNSFNFVSYYAGCLLDITTATEIQKYLAGMEVMDSITEESVQYLDIDNDGTVTIKDATTLQKYIAGLDVYIHDSVV